MESFAEAAQNGWVTLSQRLTSFCDDREAYFRSQPVADGSCSQHVRRKSTSFSSLLEVLDALIVFSEVTIGCFEMLWNASGGLQLERKIRDLPRLVPFLSKVIEFWGAGAAEDRLLMVSPCFTPLQNCEDPLWKDKPQNPLGVTRRALRASGTVVSHLQPKSITLYPKAFLLMLFLLIRNSWS